MADAVYDNRDGVEMTPFVRSSLPSRSVHSQHWGLLTMTCSRWGTRAHQERLEVDDYDAAGGGGAACDLLERVDPLGRRMADVALAAVLLAVGWVPLVLGMLALKIESPSEPVLYRQARLGRGGRVFEIVKLRTMHTGAEDGTGAVLARRRDPRATPVGRMLRVYHIDELPQLFQVLAGHMSVVGPRPERPALHEQIRRSVPGFDRRLEVKPGITGWAQVHGGYDATPAEKLERDLFYIENRSPVLDARILIKTVGVVARRLGAR